MIVAGYLHRRQVEMCQKCSPYLRGIFNSLEGVEWRLVDPDRIRISGLEEIVVSG